MEEIGGQRYWNREDLTAIKARTQGFRGLLRTVASPAVGDWIETSPPGTYERVEPVAGYTLHTGSRPVSREHFDFDGIASLMQRVCDPNFQGGEPRPSTPEVSSGA